MPTTKASPQASPRAPLRDGGAAMLSDVERAVAGDHSPEPVGCRGALGVSRPTAYERGAEASPPRGSFSATALSAALSGKAEAGSPRAPAAPLASVPAIQRERIARVRGARNPSRQRAETSRTLSRHDRA
jgi:hypothetical protein